MKKMESWELKEHLGRLVVGTFLTLLVGLGLLLIGVMITSLDIEGLIVLGFGVILLLIIGYWVGSWILG